MARLKEKYSYFDENDRLVTVYENIMPTKTKMKVYWNDFLSIAVKEYPKEVAGFLFSQAIYTKQENWWVFPVENISETPEEEWIPDKKDLHRIKRLAIKHGLVKIGDVHTHPYPKNEDYSEKLKDEIIKPSEKDLKFARKFNDIIRIILCVGEGKVYDFYVHDKFGNRVYVVLE